MNTRPIPDPTKNVLDLVAADARRQDEIRALDRAHQRELQELQRYYEEKLRLAEEKRNDANRQGDLKLTDVLSDRVRQLEKVQNEGAGKIGTITPVIFAIGSLAGMIIAYLFQKLIGG